MNQASCSITLDGRGELAPPAQDARPTSKYLTSAAVQTGDAVATGSINPLPVPVRDSGATLDSESSDPQPVRYAPRVLDPAPAFIMQSMLRDVIRAGTGRRARVLEREDLAGKTGTTDEYRDAWFSGFNSELVATTWIGFDQPAPLGRGEAGSRAALPIWIDFMRVALQDIPETPLALPDEVVKLYVDRETGKPTHPEDPDAIEEYFAKDSEFGPALAADGGNPEAMTVPEQVPENIREKLF